MNNIFCENCGCETYYLQFAGKHLKAICTQCGQMARVDHKPYFDSQVLEKPVDYEKATDKQVNYIKGLITKCNFEKLSKDEAGDIIAMFRRTKEE